MWRQTGQVARIAMGAIRPPRPPLDTLPNIQWNGWENVTERLNSLSLTGVMGVPGILDPVKRIPINVPLISPNLGKEYIIPGENKNSVFEDPTPSLKIIEDPRASVEKLAARLIVIRRTKMNKHKLRKLRKKMHYKWTKVKERRYIRKEKAYLDEKMALINAAMKFDAKEYVASIIKRAKEEPIPRKWRDPLMPEWFKEQEMEKESRLKRYQKVINMYVNKPIKIKMPD